jgi:hypothetical protein
MRPLNGLTRREGQADPANLAGGNIIFLAPQASWDHPVSRL